MKKSTVKVAPRNVVLLETTQNKFLGAIPVFDRANNCSVGFTDNIEHAVGFFTKDTATEIAKRLNKRGFSFEWRIRN